jgi:hypothetical protein
MKLGAVVSCGLALGCAARIPALPSQGGPSWRELKSPHFVLWTDADSGRGRELLQEMEHIRTIITGVAFPDDTFEGVTFVIALRDKRETRMFTEGFHLARTMNANSSPLDQPTILIPADAYGDLPEVAQEVAYAVADGAIRHQPWWFSIGFGMYFKTIDLDEHAGTAEVGRIGAASKRTLELRRTTVANLMACTETTCADDNLYFATAWAYFAYLLTKHPAELTRLEHELSSQSSANAWQTVFPAFDPAQANKELWDWINYGGLAIHSYKIELKQWPITERTLGDADAYTARAILEFRGDRERAKADAASALAVDADHPMAWAVKAMLERTPPSVDVAHAIVAHHPEDWIAWSLLVAAKGSDAAAAEAKMCELAAKNPALHINEHCKATPRSAPQPAP